MRKILTKIVSSLISLLILAVALLVIFLNSEHFQNYIIEEVTQFYGEELGCRVRVKHVRFKLTHFQLDSLELDDQQHDSLCRIARLDLYPKPASLLTRHIVFQKMVCHQGRFNFMVHPGVKGTNIDFLRKYFLKKPSGKPKRAPAIFDITDIRLNDCQISWSNKRKKEAPAELDLNYLVFNHLNADLQQFRLIGDSIHTLLKHLDFVEKCGWRVDTVAADLTICDHEMRFDDFRLVTPYSRIKRKLVLNYDEYEDLEEPVDSVLFSGEIASSLVSMRDLSYFNHVLKGMTQDFWLSGKFNGQISNLKTKDVYIRYGKRSYFKGKARFRGLPDVDETYMDIQAEEAATDHSDLSYLLMTDAIPSQISNAGLINFKGHFNGFIHDFVTDGRFVSEIGELSSDMNMKIPAGSELPSYSGRFALNGFNVGAFYKNKELGTADMSAQIQGQGFLLKDLRASFTTDIKRIQFHGYDYIGTTAGGTLYNKKFTGNLTTRDPNVGLDFHGTVDLHGKEPIYKFTAQLKEAALYPLHFDSNQTILSTQMNIDVRGKNTDNLAGKIYFNEITIDRGNLHYPLRKIQVDADTRSEKGFISLRSDIADADISGVFDLAALPTSLQYVFHHYLPAYVDAVNKPFKQDFIYHAEIKNTDIISKLLLPRMKVGSGSISGSFSSAADDIELQITNSLFSWDQLVMKDIVLKANKAPAGNRLKISQTLGEFSLNDSVRFSNITFNGQLQNDSFNYRLISNEPGQPYNCDWNGYIFFSGDSVDMHWNDSRMLVQRKNYNILPGSRILFANSKINFQGFGLTSQSERITADGYLGEDQDDALDLAIDRFDIGFINSFVKTIDEGLHGFASGKLTVKRGLGRPVFIANVLCEKTIAGPDTLGDVKLYTNYDDESNTVQLESSVVAGYLKGCEARGTIDLNKDTKLFLEVNVPKTPVARFAWYARPLASGLEGSVSGKFKVRGTPTSPLVTGRVFFDDCRFTVDYIKTRYSFNQHFDLYENYIDLNRFYIFDENGHTGLVSGRVYHQNYENLRYDIHIDNCKSLLCLNTGKKDNTLYYGKAYASGNAYFSGTPDDFAMELNAKSEKGTVICIPLGAPEEAGNVDFIRFVRKDSALVKTGKVQGPDLSGLRMNFNFEMTPDAEIQLVFDEALGDIMKGSGNGNLRMEIDTRRNFKMYGQYTVEKGEYLFTALNVFQKKFYIKPGGTISWDGGPLDAKMNLSAYYRVRTSPDPLLLSTGVASGTSGNVSPKIAVDCNLFIKGLLFSPDIKFGISFPEIESQNSDNNTVLNTVLKQVENDNEELNRQIFSLMMLKQFLPRQGTSSGISAGLISQGSLTATVSDMISAQMSNWLSQVAPGWEINFNYNPGNVDQTQKRQVILQLVKHFLNDKLIVEGSVTNNEQAANPWQYNFSSQYIISKDGRMRVKAFSRSNNNVIYNQNVTTHGVGFFYRKEFEAILPDKKNKKLK